MTATVIIVDEVVGHLLLMCLSNTPKNDVVMDS